LRAEAVLIVAAQLLREAGFVDVQATDWQTAGAAPRQPAEGGRLEYVLHQPSALTW
jgi:hypothetical protein